MTKEMICRLSESIRDNDFYILVVALVTLGFGVFTLGMAVCTSIQARQWKRKRNKLFPRCVMFNRVRILLLGLLLCLSFCTGCSYTHLPSNFPVTAPNCEEFEIYQALHADIQDDSSLPEMLDAFAAMCQIPMETTCDLYLLEVYTSDFDGKKTVTIKVSYQFEIPSYYEMLEVGFYASYDFDETIADFDEISKK